MMCPPSVNTFFIFLRKFTDILACVHTKKNTTFIWVFTK